MTTRNNINTMGRGLAIMLIALLLGCSTGTAPQGNGAPNLLLRASGPAGQPGSNKAIQRLRLQPQLPSEAQQFLGQLARPTLPAGTAGKGTSVILPHFFTAVQPYSAGDAGFIDSSSDVQFGNPPMGGADMGAAGTSFPDNFSYVIYRMDDIVQTPGTLTINLGLVVPGTFVGVAAYNWAFGTSGQWVNIYYGDPTTTGNTITGQLSLPGEDFTNDNDDLAFAVWCLNPATVNLQSITLEEGGGVTPNYDEVEPNDDPLVQPNTLPAFDFSGFTGNVGVGGTYDGLVLDSYTFDAAAGDTVTFVVTYDPAADAVDQDGDSNLESGMLIAVFDESGWDGSDPTHIVVDGGAGGLAEVSVTIDPTWTEPYFFAVQNFGLVTDTPATDYTISAQGPGGANYDEFENNEDGIANLLGPYDDDTGPLDWDASMGSDITYPGYDGDFEDWYAFGQTAPLLPGDVIDITMTYDPVNGAMGVQLFDNSGNPALVISEDGDGSENVQYTVLGTEVQPFILVCYAPGSIAFGDYHLDGTR